jgi:excisionase family DNA binding protein
MTTKVKTQAGAIDPDRLYSYDELSEVTGLSPRKIRREIEEGRLGYVQTGPERGRKIEGQQYLDWKAARRVAPEA